MKISFLIRKRVSLSSIKYKSKQIIFAVNSNAIMMKNPLTIIVLLFASILWAQPKVEMTPRGFDPIELPTPNIKLEKLIQNSKAWAAFYNKNGYDVYNVTENSLAIDGLIENAYFYRNLGETYSYNIKYTLTIVFKDNKKYTATFAVKEIYAKDVLVKTTIADFFTPVGNLKEDFKDVKPSLERTASKLIKSYADFIAR